MENEALVLDLLEWLGRSPRPYRDVMDAWRTSCPRLTIWEDAVDAGYLEHRGDRVYITPVGLRYLESKRGTGVEKPGRPAFQP